MDMLNTYVQGNYVKKKCSALHHDQHSSKRWHKLKAGSRTDVTYGKAQKDKYGKCNP